MQISNPIYLLLLVAIPLFLFFSIRSYRQMKKWLAAFGNIRIKRVRNLGRIFLLAMVLLLVTFSLIGLSVEYEMMVTQRRGVDIVIGLDTSRSMLAEDTVIPDQSLFLNMEHQNRLNRGRLEALRFVNLLNGERVGLFYFAFRGTRVLSLTEDYSLCKYILVNSESTDITFTGSNLDHALKTGRSMFQKDSKYKVLVLISDGELEDSSQLELVVSEARNLQKDGVIVYTVGIGEDTEVLIPKRTANGSIDWFKDSKGNILKTKPDEDTLRRIAAITNGTYFHAKNYIVAEKVLNAILEKAENIKTLKKPVKRRLYLSPLFLAALLVTWLAWESLVLLSDSKRVKP